MTWLRLTVSIGAAHVDAVSELLEQFGAELQGHSLALSGCPNSCSQPQLAKLGILPVKLVKGDDGRRSPRFDLYLRNSDDLGQSIASGLDETQLFQAVADLLAHGFQPFNQGDTP